MAAGLGLSGDLKDPKRAIPIGTIAATVVGMTIYLIVAVKLATSASPDDLVSDQFIMGRVAVWGPIIPIGLACATLSSALGSMLIAPRTLEALSADRVFPAAKINAWLRSTSRRNREPMNAALVTTAIALVFVLIGDVNFVAQIISMFFMVTYGAICLISFLEHFAADPSYRPSFRSRWYVSLFGALACAWFMFEMSPLYATLSVGSMFGLYVFAGRTNPERRGLTNMFQGAVFQISRRLRVFAQKTTVVERSAWRPSVVAISRHSFERLAEFELLKWVAHRYGFGTYMHHIEGYFSKRTGEQAARDLDRLVARSGVARSNVYVDTIVCPSSTSLIAQVVQLPGISGKANNMLLFGHEPGCKDELNDLVENYQLIVAAGFDVAVLCTSNRGFGYHREVHLWLTPGDYENSTLMILLAYILLGHPDWRDGAIKIFAVAREDELDDEELRLTSLIREGRLPISRDNIEVVPQGGSKAHQELIRERSSDADLVVLGFRGELLRRKGMELFEQYRGLGNTLFVNTTKEIDLERRDDAREKDAAHDHPDPPAPLPAAAGKPAAKGTARALGSEPRQRAGNSLDRAE